MQNSRFLKETLCDVNRTEIPLVFWTSSPQETPKRIDMPRKGKYPPYFKVTIIDLRRLDIHIGWKMSLHVLKRISRAGINGKRRGRRKFRMQCDHGLLACWSNLMHQV